MVMRIYLKPGREESVLRRHPWIFSGGIARLEGHPEAGATVAVHSAEGAFLAWGQYSPASQIRVRLVSWQDTDEPDAPEFWRERLQRAIALRAPLLADGGTDACRLVFAESDGIPGLIVDRYGEVLVLQALTAGAQARRQLYADLLASVLTPGTIYERSDADVREKENLVPFTGLLRGLEPPALVPIRENGLPFWVDVRKGHKTGFYLDQRPNRQLLRQWIEQRRRAGLGTSVLNVFSYTGAFTSYALAAGAEAVINVDASAEALALGRRHWPEGAPVTDLEGDAFRLLRDLRAAGQRFDVIILDPPKFAFSQADVQRAARGYKDINLQALHLLRPGGLLFTFSCSGAIPPDLFQKIVFGAALDAGREVQLVAWLAQGADHPVALHFPESAYLKGLVGQVVL